MASNSMLPLGYTTEPCICIGGGGREEGRKEEKGRKEKASVKCEWWDGLENRINDSKNQGYRDTGQRMKGFITLNLCGPCVLLWDFRSHK